MSIEKIQKFISFLKKNNYSKSTISTYQNVIKKYNEFLFDIRLIRKKLYKYNDSPNTMWLHYNTLCSYFNFTKDKRLSQLKRIKMPAIPTKYMPVFTKKFLYRKTEDQTKKKNVIIRFLFDTGIRASELNKIIEIKKDTLLLKGKGSKIREIFHNPETTKNFKKFEFTTKTLRFWVKEVLGNQYTPHSIRRSHATYMLLNGANPKSVMLQLGHKKVETTYKYLQLSKENNKKIYRKHFLKEKKEK